MLIEIEIKFSRYLTRLAQALAKRRYTATWGNPNWPFRIPPRERIHRAPSGGPLPYPKNPFFNMGVVLSGSTGILLDQRTEAEEPDRVWLRQEHRGDLQAVISS